MEKRTYKTYQEIEALKPAAEKGKSYDVKDAKAQNLFIRVRPADSTGRFRRTFVLVTRLPGAKNTTRISLGEYGDITLKEARVRAAAWRQKIHDGINPREEAEQEARRKEEAKKRAVAEATAKERLRFGVVIEEYLSRRVRGKRRGGPAEREIRNELIPVWKDRLITEITGDDVVTLIDTITDRGAKYQAHNVFGHVRAFFKWAFNRKYGLETSPCFGMEPKQLIGEKKPRQRVLNDGELVALWEGADNMERPKLTAEAKDIAVPAGYPYGPIFRLLTLTGQRKSEVAEARWREFHPELVRLLRNRKTGSPPIDWGKIDQAWKMWTIPPERFKSDATHTVPLSDDALAILTTLPHFIGGDHLFSTTGGKLPVGNFGNAKARLDGHMLAILRKKAEERGDDPATVELPSFVLHDIRRTVRTRLSALRVPFEVAELVIGHVKQGLAKIYDQNTFDDEKREALDLWAGRLRSIISPPPANVVDIRTARNE